jgi:NAD-dependent dihydropyrimidine dehydrogenase PreA subunit
VTYVIGAGCIDELAGDCVATCPVDCIYEGARRRYINPHECIGCGACLPACPVDAITTDDDADPAWTEDNRRFFDLPLPGRSEPIGSPGGADDFGPAGADTELTAASDAAS